MSKRAPIKKSYGIGQSRIRAVTSKFDNDEEDIENEDEEIEISDVGSDGDSNIDSNDENEKKADDSADNSVDEKEPIEKKEESKSTVKKTAVRKNTVSMAATASAAAPKTKKILKTTTKTTIKKGPGRPRKTPLQEPIPRKGITTEPQHEDSFMELLYDQPIIMKKIFAFLKSIQALQLQIIFRPTEIIFYGIDHTKKTKIRIKIDATKLNSYYCRGTLDIGIATAELTRLLNKIDNSYRSITIFSDLATSRRNITLVLDNHIQITELHRVDLIGTYDKLEDEELFNDEDYTIRFELPSNYFKKTVSDIKTLSPQIAITQDDNQSPLVIQYISPNCRVHSKHTMKDSKIINLDSRLPDGESFRIDVLLDYLKPIASSQITDRISILVDEQRPFMTRALINDDTIEIKTITEIINEQPEDEA
jgi:hypothetical protein